MTQLKPLDIAEYLDDEEDMQAYLAAILEENNPALLRMALGDIARAKGMTEIAQKAGVNRQSLYKSLSEDGKPAFDTVQKIIHALGLKLTVTA